MEQPPLINEPNWQSITIEDIHRLIARDELDMAKRRVEILRDGLIDFVEDVDKQSDASIEGDWPIEKEYIEKQLTELDQITNTLENELPRAE